MRPAAMLLALAAALGACSPLRRAPAPDPVPTAEAPPAAAQPVEPHLGCLEHPRIDVWERRLRSTPAHRLSTRKSLERGAPYLPRLREIMVEAGLPPSLALLPVVESGFRPNARGRFGDLGLWQLRRPTARRFGLVVDAKRDDRLHPERSTRAAARYLRLLHRRYDDWPFALAAYNAGEARVDRARRRLPTASFWELAERGHLPRTSREFVPRFLAVVRVSEDPGACAALATREAPGGRRLASP